MYAIFTSNQCNVGVPAQVSNPWPYHQQVWALALIHVALISLWSSFVTTRNPKSFEFPRRALLDHAPRDLWRKPKYQRSMEVMPNKKHMAVGQDPYPQIMLGWPPYSNSPCMFGGQPARAMLPETKKVTILTDSLFSLPIWDAQKKQRWHQDEQLRALGKTILPASACSPTAWRDT